MGFVSKLLTREPRSKDIARQRLQLVLVRDRQSLSPGLMQTIRDEIILAISKHLEVDEDNTKLTLSQSAGHHRLIVDIPLQGRARRA
ncbi:MAG TPA: cell division topological specificity factor MinE [Anaerolineae bacterium]|nr:cell division topological specificity factor MinE [Anaerolineae bacterium]